ncbi:hypothetical protein BDA99DRAFT_572069 [Phascolomyces articulosus]|uniref:Uncharacterized protein n=1 Tax=Phascolomyces articulosus TaxID=60185 RepID=A0AAD5K0X0_9FUNG|nr:hypothetical protein BDA99DRAFT_572069 [Phascolomyces articulosus]
MYTPQNFCVREALDILSTIRKHMDSLEIIDANFYSLGLEHEFDVKDIFGTDQVKLTKLQRLSFSSDLNGFVESLILQTIINHNNSGSFSSLNTLQILNPYNIDAITNAMLHSSFPLKEFELAFTDNTEGDGSLIQLFQRYATEITTLESVVLQECNCVTDQVVACLADIPTLFCIGLFGLLSISSNNGITCFVKKLTTLGVIIGIITMMDKSIPLQVLGIVHCVSITQVAIEHAKWRCHVEYGEE